MYTQLQNLRIKMYTQLQDCAYIDNWNYCVLTIQFVPNYVSPVEPKKIPQ